MTTMILGALAIGLMLGLLGSGGSILTVPVLVYLLGHDDKTAIAESLAIVGGIALASVFPYARSHQVDWRSVALFGLPGMAGTYGGAWLAQFVAGPVQLVLFACVMLLAAGTMIRQASRSRNKSSWAETDSQVKHSAPARGKAPQAGWKIVLEGLAVGVLTGLVGVGGGFLIVPALVVLGGLSMRLAVGTSLAVIALKSFSGFYKYLGVLDSLGGTIDWQTVGVFTLAGIVGSVAGHWLSSRMNQTTLQRGFALILVAMAIFVLGREIPHVWPARAKAQAATTSVTSLVPLGAQR